MIKSNINRVRLIKMYITLFCQLAHFIRYNSSLVKKYFKQPQRTSPKCQADFITLLLMEILTWESYN